MRILLVTQYYWPENFLVNSLVEILIERGIEVTVLTGKPNYPDGKIFKGYKAWGLDREQRKQTNILRLPILPRGKGSNFRLALNYFSFILSGIFFGRKLIGKYQYDLVFVYGTSPLLQALPAIWLAKSKKVPVVIWVQDLWPESLSFAANINNKIILSIVARFVRYIYRSI